MSTTLRALVCILATVFLLSVAVDVVSVRDVEGKTVVRNLEDVGAGRRIDDVGFAPRDLDVRLEIVARLCMPTLARSCIP